MPLSLAKCTYAGTVGFKIADHPTPAKVQKSEREKYEQLTTTNTLKIAELQDRLYAESREGVVILIQAMDAAGKDSAIKHVIPADQKWFARYLISEAIVGTLEDVDPHYLEIPVGQMARLTSSRDSLCGNEG